MGLSCRKGVTVIDRFQVILFEKSTRLLDLKLLNQERNSIRCYNTSALK